MKKILKRFTSASSPKSLQDKVIDRPHVAVLPVGSPEAGDQVTSYIPSMASLERLPTEIQSAILLNIDDVTSLKSLIHASPRYHSTYLTQRHAVFESVLFNSIHPDVLYDAFAAVDSNTTLSSDVKDRATRVKTFLSEYKDNRHKWTPPEHLDLGRLSGLARLQNQVQNATEDLCRVASSSHPFTGTQVQHGGPLSANESRRFQRAFYRFEIFCNLFRNWKSPPADESLSDASNRGRESSSGLDSMEKSSRFLGLFNPWEVEELACVRDYFYNYYRRMLHKFEPELRERKPKLDLSDDGMTPS